MVKKIDENADKLSGTIKSSEAKLDKIDRNTTDLSNRMEELEREVKTKDQHIDLLSKKIYDLEQEKRDRHVIIEGLQEDRNESLRSKLDDLFMALELPYDSKWVDLAYRIGTRNNKSICPRAVKISFPFLR